MGYRNPYEDRDKLFQNNIEAKPVNQREVKRRLEDLFSGPKKPVEDRCRSGHKWLVPPDGPTRCSVCKVLKPRGQ